MMDAPGRMASKAATWRLCLAPLIWAAHFLAIYAFTALACARKGTGGWFDLASVPWFIGGATLLAAAILLVTIAVAIRAGRRDTSSTGASTFVHWLTAAIAALVLLAVVWETLPLIWVPVCG